MSSTLSTTVTTIEATPRYSRTSNARWSVRHVHTDWGTPRWVIEHYDHEDDARAAYRQFVEWGVEAELQYRGPRLASFDVVIAAHRPTGESPRGARKIENDPAVASVADAIRHAQADGADPQAVARAAIFAFVNTPMPTSGD